MKLREQWKWHLDFQLLLTTKKSPKINVTSRLNNILKAKPMMEKLLAQPLIQINMLSNFSKSLSSLQECIFILNWSERQPKLRKYNWNFLLRGQPWDQQSVKYCTCRCTYCIVFLTFLGMDAQRIGSSYSWNRGEESTKLEILVPELYI